RALVAKQLALPSNAQFLPEYETRQGPSGVWTVQSQVIVSRGAKNVRHKWRADVAQKDGQWQLRALTVDGRNMYSAAEKEDPVRLASSSGSNTATPAIEEPADVGPVGDEPVED